MKENCRAIGLDFYYEKKNKNHLSPIDHLEYIYAVFTSPTIVGEITRFFLKMISPKRFLIQKTKNTFWQWVNLAEKNAKFIYGMPKVDIT